jgi:hypothetical protein
MFLNSFGKAGGVSEGVEFKDGVILARYAVGIDNLLEVHSEY